MSSPTVPAWQSKLAFLTPKATTHKVGGKDLKFYPISMGLIFKLREIGKPVAIALSSIFDSTKNDFGTIDRQVSNDKGGLDREIIVEPSKIEVIQFRAKARQDAFSGLIEAFLNDNSRDLIGEIIIDSLKEQFPRDGNDNPSPAEFMGTIDPNHIADLIVGVSNANKGMFGPLAGLLQGRLEQVLKRVKESAAGRVAETAGTTKTPQSESPAEPNDPPAPLPLQKTDG